MQKELLNIKRHLLSTNKGFSLVEVLLSIVLLALLAGTFVSSLIYGQESERLAGDRARAVFLAEEGMEAVRNMRDENFSNLTTGTHGLAISGNQWTFSGSSDVADVFTRSISISDIDANTKNVKVDVNWKQNEQRDGIISLESRLTNWKKIRLTEAEQLAVDTSNSEINPADATQVLGLTVENIENIGDITITQMEVSWTGAPNGTRISEISIDGNSIWSGSSGSGSVEDVTDFILVQGQGAYLIDFLDFSKDMTGSTITIIFTMLDGSTKQVSFSPGAPPDTVPPADISNLFTSGATANSINLSWTAPGDDGNSGTASSYDIRYSASPITGANWSSAIQVSGEPTPSVAGTSETMTISGLAAATQYYFAIKTSDEVPNESGLSNVASGTTLAPPQANYLVVNTAGAQVNPANRTQVIGIALQNSGSTNITIATMTVSWSGVQGNRRLTGITIDGVSRWTGNATSGTTENITDVTIAPGATVPLNFLQFNNTLANITVNISFTMADGSIKTVGGIGPLP